MKLIVRTLAVLLFIASLVVLPAPADAAGATFTSTYYGGGIWQIWRDQYHYALSYNQYDAASTAHSLNLTDECANGCTNPPYPPCNYYQVIIADHESWYVTRNYTTIVAEVNFETDAYTIRNSLRVTHSGGVCPATR